MLFYLINCSGDVRKAHSMESLVQTGSDIDKASSIPPSPSAPSKLHRSWSGKKRNGSNSEMDGVGSKGDKNKRSSKYIYDIQGIKMTKQIIRCMKLF